jgi:hypothetical protein
MFYSAYIIVGCVNIEINNYSTRVSERKHWEYCLGITGEDRYDTTGMYSVYRRGRGFEVDYEMNDNNNAYQRAGI